MHPNYLLNIYIYTHRPRLLSALHREASFCSGQLVVQSHNWSECCDYIIAVFSTLYRTSILLAARPRGCHRRRNGLLEELRNAVFWRLRVLAIMYTQKLRMPAQDPPPTKIHKGRGLGGKESGSAGMWGEQERTGHRRVDLQYIAYVYEIAVFSPF